MGLLSILLKFTVGFEKLGAWTESSTHDMMLAYRVLLKYLNQIPEL